MGIDGRSLDHEKLEQIRLDACRRVSKGERPSEVMRFYGLCRTTIYVWLRAARKGGAKALLERKPKPPQRVLGVRKQRELRRLILTKDPRHFGYASALWSRPIVQDLIAKRYKVSLGLTAVGNLLRSLGLSPQKPLRRAYERDPRAIKEWKKEAFPKLRKRAKRRNAVILFVDEAGFRSDDPLGRTWGKKGSTPTVATSGRREQVSAASAVGMNGEFRYCVYDDRMTASLFIRILQHFAKGIRRPVFFVVDGHPSHRAKAVKEWVQSMKGKVEIHFLPPYAPDLNPDEFVWHYMKQNGTRKAPLQKGESLKKRVIRQFQGLARNKALVRSFFNAASVDYLSA